MIEGLFVAKIRERCLGMMKDFFVANIDDI